MAGPEDVEIQLVELWAEGEDGPTPGYYLKYPDKFELVHMMVAQYVGSDAAVAADHALSSADPSNPSVFFLHSMTQSTGGGCIDMTTDPISTARCGREVVATLLLLAAAAPQGHAAHPIVIHTYWRRAPPEGRVQP